MYKLFLKRVLDIILSTIAIVILSPAFIVIAILVRITMGSPVLFSQERIGKDEIPFSLRKFRTMTNAVDSYGNLLDEKLRTTNVGNFLRSTSLDELPELFSIFVGKMSFVGPRPLPTYYLDYFFDNERRRHKVKGGLIPPDSLSGNAYTSYEEQFQYECNYVDQISFKVDCTIIVKTFKILLNRMKTNYGTEFERPHLNKYRAWMDEGNKESKM